MLIFRLEAHHPSNTRSAAVLWHSVGSGEEYLGCLPGLLSFAITAGCADPSRGGPAP